MKEKGGGIPGTVFPNRYFIKGHSFFNGESPAPIVPEIT